MVLVPPQFQPSKGDLKAEYWGATAPSQSEQVYNTAPPARQHARTRVRTRKQPDTPIEQEEYYLAIVYRRDGGVQLKSSASLKSGRKQILSSITDQFVNAVRVSRSDSLTQPSVDRFESKVSQELDASILGLEEGVGSISYPFRRPQKRPRANTDLGSMSDSAERGSKSARVQTVQDGVRKTISFEISDTQRAEKWIIEAFEAVQQVTCRLIAKLWIKKIEPKKQSAHPYNGGLPKDEPIKDPERTKPPYWPPGIPHKEPDHIQKNQRVTLLTHLVMHTPYQQLVSKDKVGDEIGAAALESQTAERKNDIAPEKYEILQEIFRVRKLMEMHIEGGQDGSTVVTVLDCSKPTRLDQGETEEDIEDEIPIDCHEPDVDSEDTERPEPAVQAPIASTEPSPIERQRLQDINTVSNRVSSSFSNQGCDILSDPQPVRQVTRSFEGFQDSFGRSMGGNMIERSSTSDISYSHHGIPYSPLQVSQDTTPWAEYNNSDAFSHVSHMGAPVHADSTVVDYGIYSCAPPGSMATITHSLPCSQNFYRQQSQLDQLQRQIQHQHDLVPELGSQPPRDIPYRTSPSRSQQMALSRHNSYDQPMLQSGFYHM